jgi:hypothetical protein
MGEHLLHSPQHSGIPTILLTKVVFLSQTSPASCDKLRFATLLLRNLLNKPFTDRLAPHCVMMVCGMWHWVIPPPLGPQLILRQKESHFNNQLYKPMTNPEVNIY